MGYMTGITYTNPLPRTDYEVTLEAMRVEGSDFFCGLTFPVGSNSCSLVVGDGAEAWWGCRALTEKMRRTMRQPAIIISRRAGRTASSPAGNRKN